MDIKVVYVLSRLPEWIEVVKNLRAELGWEPFYWITVPKIHDLVGEHFPEVIRHRSADANRCLPAPGLEHLAHHAIDPPLLRKFADHEAIAMDLMDRMGRHMRDLKDPVYGWFRRMSPVY